MTENSKCEIIAVARASDDPPIAYSEIDRKIKICMGAMEGNYEQMLDNWSYEI